MGGNFEAPTLRSFGTSKLNTRKARNMRLIEKNGAVEIWEVRQPWGFDYLVYGVLSDPRIAPSLGCAREWAAAK
jgi:hypothetical protein